MSTASASPSASAGSTLGRSAQRLPGRTALAYAAAYLGWVWFTRESEVAHWVTLVAIPLGALLIAGWRRTGRPSLPAALAEVGLRRGNLRAGLWLAVGLGLAIGGLQLVISGSAPRLREVMQHPSAWLMVPVAFAMMLVTAGFTEELFFRGVLQERLSRWWGSDVAAVLVASVVFGLYHFPYRYLTPGTGATGDVLGSLADCAFAAVIGLVLGRLYVHTHRNLLACVVLHAMVNTVPLLTMIRIG